jgi:hypothetical protein
MKNQTNPCATFSLKTYDVPLTVGTNAFGSLNNAYRSSMTWSNVDLKTIMGTMWETYDYFTITLVSSISAGVTATPANIFDRSGIINLQGLQFINSSYSISAKANLPLISVGIVSYAMVTVGSLTQNNFLSGAMFVKGKSIVDLSITLTRVTDGTLLLGTGITGTDQLGVFPHQIYQFRIDGVNYKE